MAVDIDLTCDSLRWSYDQVRNIEAEVEFRVFRRDLRWVYVDPYTADYGSSGSHWVREPTSPDDHRRDGRHEFHRAIPHYTTNISAAIEIAGRMGVLLMMAEEGDFWNAIVPTYKKSRYVIAGDNSTREGEGEWVVGSRVARPVADHHPAAAIVRAALRFAREGR